MSILIFPTRAVLALRDSERPPAWGTWDNCVAAFREDLVDSVGCRACGVTYPVRATTDHDSRLLGPDLETGEFRCPAGHLLTDSRSKVSRSFIYSDTPDPVACSVADDESFLEALELFHRFQINGNADDARLAVTRLRASRLALADAALGLLYFRHLTPMDFEVPETLLLGVDLDRQKALIRLRRAAEYGIPGAVQILLERRSAGEQVIDHPDGGDSYLAKVRDSMPDDAFHDLERLEECAGWNRPGSVLAILSIAARWGIHSAPKKLFDAWRRFRDGDGVEKDLTVAIAFLRAAVDAGSSDALYYLAISYLKGFGVERQPQFAIELLEKADSADAHWALSRIFSREDIVTPDSGRAKRHLARAKSLGHPKAQLTDTESTDRFYEVRLKLTLASEYVEMGDVNAACELIAEVRTELRDEALRLRSPLLQGDTGLDDDDGS